MAHCSAVWIVAPINRAVDDKTASKLLGDSFKLQLKMDGTYSNVTFICTKTDDISIREAMDGLGLHDELAKYQFRSQELQEERDKAENLEATLVKSANAKTASLKRMERRIEDWKGLRGRVDRGETVYLPERKKSQKRKRYHTRRLRSQKNGDREESEDSESDSIQAATERDSNSLVYEVTPLTAEAVANKLAEYTASAQSLREAIEASDIKLNKVTEQLDHLDIESQNLEEARPIRRCIRGRNGFSVEKIKTDFAAGVRE